VVLVDLGAEQDYRQYLSELARLRPQGVGKFCAKWLARVGYWDDDVGCKVPDRVYVGLTRLVRWAEQ
jgi:hypothetical protein